MRKIPKLHAEATMYSTLETGTNIKTNESLPEACDLEWDLGNDCDVDKKDAKMLKLRQKFEKPHLK